MALANMLDWHRREQKASWWEYFRLCALPDEELIEERAAVAGLTFLGRVDTPKKSVVDRYGFLPQECELRKGNKARRRARAAPLARWRPSIFHMHYRHQEGTDDR